MVSKRAFTLVTTRRSCFNFVKHQNGVVGRAHASLFIPSTMCGQSESETGVSQEKLQENMEAALQVYLERVNNISFISSTIIKMYRGATDQRALYIKEDRKDLLVFLRGKKVEKTELKRTKPERYRYFKVCGVYVSGTWCKTCQVNMFLL